MKGVLHMNTIRVQILMNQQSKRDILAKKLEPIDYVQLERPIVSGQSIEESFRNDHSDVILVSEQYEGNGYLVSAEISKLYPNKSIIMIKGTDVRTNIKETLLSNASDIIAFDVTTQYLTDIIYTVHQANVEKNKAIRDSQVARLSQQGSIYTVFSTKGGSGKTFFATNLAVTLAKETGKRVVIVDLDLDYGGASTALNLEARTSLTNAIDDIHHLDTDLMEGYLIKHESGVSVLAADPNPSIGGYASADQIDVILKTLKNSFDYIVVDMPGRFMEEVNPAFTLATTVFLITTPEVLTLKNVRNALVVFRELSYPLDRIKLILNKAGGKGVTRRDVETTLDHKVVASIPEDYERVRKSQNEGAPYVTTSPRSNISAAFMGLVNDHILVNITDNVKSKKKGWRRK